MEAVKGREFFFESAGCGGRDYGFRGWIDLDREKGERFGIFHG